MKVEGKGIWKGLSSISFIISAIVTGLITLVDNLGLQIMELIIK